MNKIFLICTLSLFVFTACAPDTTVDKWSHPKLSKIIRNERSRAKRINHDQKIYGTWYLSTNKNITLQFSSESKWQFHKKTADTINSHSINGNNFTMNNGILSLYRNDGEIIVGQYKFNDENHLTTSMFDDNNFNGNWIRK
jgi:hypothetical protein